MCKFIYKRKGRLLLQALLISAFIGISFCLFCGAARYKATSIDGVDISGLSIKAAQVKVERALQKQLKGKALIIQVGEKGYTFRYPELYYRTNLSEVVQKAVQKGGRYSLEKRLCLTNLEDSLRGICDANYRQSIDATVLFHGIDRGDKPTFQYTKDRKGYFVDGKKLKQDVEKALDGDFKRKVVYAKTIYKDARFQVADAKRSTQLLSSFCTYFATTNLERTHNITLASSFINGATLQTGETFSFNERVGARTTERGFQEAHIIQEGEFVNGVGGGVCQVSTTIYNAALLSGLQIVEYHPHSLHVGYVPPSFDAMVNGRVCDLKFKNPYDMPIYIASRVLDNQLRVEIYGMPNGINYSRESVLVEKITPPDPEVVVGDEEKVVRPAKEGIRSEGYLIIEKDGIIERKKIRTDNYKCVQGKLQILPEQQPEQNSIEHGAENEVEYEIEYEVKYKEQAE